MVARALTDLDVRSLKAQPVGRYEVFDQKLPGFGVRVSENGTKSFILMYRRDGRQRRLTLGHYPTLNLAQARKLARTALNKVAHGSDPQREKDEVKASISLNEAIEGFYKSYCLRFNRATTAKETRRLLTRYFALQWGRRDIRSIERAEIIRRLDRIVADGAPGGANHGLAALRRFFGWCVDRGYVTGNPCSSIKAPAPINSRDRVLADAELAAVWRTADEIGYPFGTIVQLLILTAQRRGEVTEMRWSEIDFDKALWTIPARRTKSNRVHSVPLSSATSKLLSEVPRLDADRVFAALGNATNSYSGFSKSKRRLDGQSGVESWVLHDLRRTTATGMARSGIAPHVIERVLNHSTGVLGGVAGVYNRFGYLPEMRVALEQWSAFVTANVAAAIGANQAERNVRALERMGT